MDSELNQAVSKAATYCSKREACIFDIKKKLYQWKISENLYPKIIAQLLQQNYINEKRFAGAYVNDKYKFNHWGRLKIKYNLLTLNIKPELIHEALKKIDKKEYLAIAKKEICFKAKNIDFENYWKAKQKILRYITSKGFESEFVLEIIDECINNILRKNDKFA